MWSLLWSPAGDVDLLLEVENGKEEEEDVNIKLPAGCELVVEEELDGGL